MRALKGGRTAPSFREAFKRRRCLIAAEGWVEWKGEGKPKPKFSVEPRNGEPICFAGLWDRAKTEDAGEVRSFTMVTQPPGADVDDLLTAEPTDLYRIRAFHEAAIATM